MAIEFHCPHCDKRLRTPDDKAGLRAKCPGCGEPVTVPSPSTEQFGGTDEVDYGAQDYGGHRADTGDFAAPPTGTSLKTCPMCGEQIQAAAIKCRFCGEDLGRAPQSLGERRYLNYAGFWLRFVAAFIDGLILGAVNFVILLALGGPVDLAPASEGLANLASIVIGWLYFALMESSENQATLGKMALGITVTDSRGNQISFGRASGRHFAKIISALICLIGYIMAGFTERKQALHDMLADCLVIRKA